MKLRPNGNKYFNFTEAALKVGQLNDKMIVTTHQFSRWPFRTLEHKAQNRP